MGCRLVARVLPRGIVVRGRLPLVWVGALGVIAAVLTALGEAAYFRLAFGVDPMRVIAANWSLVTGVRPAAIVLAPPLARTPPAAAPAPTFPPPTPPPASAPAHDG